jgi:hypothetical protein
MAAKKKQEVEPKASVEVIQPEPVAVSPVAEVGACIDCRFIVTGTWRGPTCSNPDSPKFKQRVPDAGSCEKFSPRKRQTAPSLEAHVNVHVSVDSTDEGQYDPTPLAELLARETEAGQDGSK